MNITEKSIQKGMELKLFQTLLSATLSTSLLIGNYMGLFGLHEVIALLACIALQYSFFWWKLRNIYFSEACQEHGLKGNESILELYRKFGLPSWL